MTCLDALPLDGPGKASILSEGRFLLYEHKFLEKILQDDVPGALTCLQTQLTPLATASMKQAAQEEDGVSEASTTPIGGALGSVGEFPSGVVNLMPRLQQLATCMLIQSPGTLKAATGWGGPEDGSRDRYV